MTMPSKYKWNICYKDTVLGEFRSVKFTNVQGVQPIQGFPKTLKSANYDPSGKTLDTLDTLDRLDNKDDVREVLGE